MFRSLRVRNFRLYFFGQTVSMAGTFMQVIAQAWLVLQLTGSGTALGILTTLQFGPMLVLGGPAGVLVDRVDRRRLYAITESLLGLQALALGVLVTTGSVQLWMVYTLALMFGVVTVIDQPTRQTLIMDLVGPDDLTNAVSLNMSVGSMARAAGPAIAGITIAVLGVGPCFLLNALSFAVMVVALGLMRTAEMHAAEIEPPAPGQFRAGLRYVWSAREVLSILVLLGLAFGIAWEYEVALPLVAKFTFDGNAATYGVLASAVGIGAVVGGLEAARRGSSARAGVAAAGFVFATGLWVATLAPSIPVACVALFFAGAGGLMFTATATARLQLRTLPRMRGRVMALYAVAVFGTRVIGGPIVGWCGEHLGARASVGVGAVTLSVAVPLWYFLAPHDGRRGPGGDGADPGDGAEAEDSGPERVGVEEIADRRRRRVPSAGGQPRSEETETMRSLQAFLVPTTSAGALDSALDEWASELLDRFPAVVGLTRGTRTDDPARGVFLERGCHFEDRMTAYVEVTVADDETELLVEAAKSLGSALATEAVGAASCVVISEAVHVRGEAGPVALFHLLRRRVASREEFRQYWGGFHAERGYWKGEVPRTDVPGYWQHHVDHAASERAARASGFTFGDFDGVSASYAASVDAYLANVTSARNVSSLGDNTRFIDVDRSPYLTLWQLRA